MEESEWYLTYARRKKKDKGVLRVTGPVTCVSHVLYICMYQLLTFHRLSYGVIISTNGLLSNPILELKRDSPVFYVVYYHDVE